jgi:hypothetical protein
MELLRGGEGEQSNSTFQIRVKVKREQGPSLSTTFLTLTKPCGVKKERKEFNG